jgi:hypothetical protein
MILAAFYYQDCGVKLVLMMSSGTFNGLDFNELEDLIF